MNWKPKFITFFNLDRLGKHHSRYLFHTGFRSTLSIRTCKLFGQTFCNLESHHSRSSENNKNTLVNILFQREIFWGSPSLKHHYQFSWTSRFSTFCWVFHGSSCALLNHLLRGNISRRSDTREAVHLKWEGNVTQNILSKQRKFFDTINRKIMST